jgi:hypothetical protein
MRSGYLMELPLLLRRTHRIAIAAGAKIFFASGAILLAGCSDIPSAYNPIDWTKSGVDEVSSWFESKPAPEGAIAEPPPAEGRPYPNLATVPKPPPRITPEIRAQREREIAGLQANRQAALTADNTLRQTGALPPAASQPAVAPPSPMAQPSPFVTSPQAIAPPLSTPPPAATPAPSSAALAQVAPPVAPPAADPAPEPAAPPLTFKQRMGQVAFGKDTPAPTRTSQRVLQTAAARALELSARVHIMPAEFAREAVIPQLERGRRQAMLQTLERAGLPANRIVVDPDLGWRVDLYDIYVEK